MLFISSGELSWSRCGARSGAHRLALSGVLSVSPVDCPPAGAPLDANNIFQIGMYRASCNVIVRIKKYSNHSPLILYLNQILLYNIPDVFVVVGSLL